MANYDINALGDAASRLMAISPLVSQLTESAVQQLMTRYLSDTDTVHGAAKHILAGLTTEATSILMSPLTGPRSKLNNMVQYYTDQFSVDPATAQFMNDMYSMFQQPNIEGITIFTEAEQTSRKMDISEQPLVVQRSVGSTVYATDNAVPHPREWSLKGHLTTVLPTDHFFIIKPSLTMQRQYLDMCMKSRRPVWFKTYDNTFALILIADMTTTYDPKSMNTMGITLTLKEFVPITVTEGPVSKEIATYVGGLL